MNIFYVSDHLSDLRTSTFCHLVTCSSPDSIKIVTMETHADDPPDDKQVTIPACSVVTTDGWRYNQLKQNDSDKHQDNGDLDQDDKVIHHEKIICLDNKVKHKDVKVKFIDENVKQIINSLVDLTSQGQDDKFTSDLESSTRPRENHVMYSTVTCLIVMMGLVSYTS